MNIDTKYKYWVGYAWDDGPTGGFNTKEEAIIFAETLRENSKTQSSARAYIYIWELLEII